MVCADTVKLIEDNNKIVIATEWSSDEVDRIIKYFSEKISTVTNIEIVLQSKFDSDAEILIKQSKNKNFGKEAYNLSVTEKQIEIEVANGGGLFYAFQTILQLLPSQVYSDSKIDDIDFALPCVIITDKPKYKWRGFMLDVSRHFFPKEFIFDVLDYLAMHKMNTFHWHLVDDQGWRIEIKKYPKLTEVGAWRADREDQPWNSDRAPQRKGEKATYGGYYTQDDIKEIVKYAEERFITIVPEIEMPGHCTSALSGYPQYSCTGEQFTLPTGSIWGDRKIYCAGNDETFEFLNNILAEVIEMFPDQYIHIGGDEAKKGAWEVCKKCQARIKSEGLKNVEELQGYFINRTEKFINSKKRTLIGWDEILEGGLSPNATVMSWRGLSGGITAAREGHDVVFSPTDYCYFDFYQGNPEYEPPAYAHFLPMKKVYSFDPSLKDSLTVEEQKHILGVQANLWTEYVPTESQAEYMMFPRLSALSEVAWVAQEERSWTDFTQRLEKQFKRYDALGINYSKTAYNVTAKYEVDKEQYNIIVTLENEIGNTQIRYTTDGTEPTANSNLYLKPFNVNKVITIKGATFKSNEIISRVTNLDVLANMATGLPVKVEHKYDKRYTAAKEFALTDGIRGSVNYTNGEWQGYFGVDLVATIDLLKEKSVNKVTVSFLESIGAGIFFPKEIEVLVSENGTNFNKVSTLKVDKTLIKKETVIEAFAISFETAKCKYVKVVAKTIGKCPKGHKYEGAEAFMFVDEIVVE
ncbi:MAG: family 20 glycosylhydrolase [Methylococcales bacterium]